MPVVVVTRRASPEALVDTFSTVHTARRGVGIVSKLNEIEHQGVNMNAIDLLKEDHDVVDALFKRVEETPPSRHAPMFKRIKNELDAHAHIEEKIFYPALEAKGKKNLKEITAEAWEEHAQMKKFLKEIARSTDKDKIEAKLKVLIEDTRHHVKEEENEMFPMVKDQFSSDALNELGGRMVAEKVKFQKAKKIPPRPPAPKGTIEKVLDKAKKAAASIIGGSNDGAKSSAKTKTGGSANGSGAVKSGSRARKTAVSVRSAAQSKKGTSRSKGSAGKSAK